MRWIFRRRNALIMGCVVYSRDLSRDGSCPAQIGRLDALNVMQMGWRLELATGKGVYFGVRVFSL